MEELGGGERGREGRRVVLLLNDDTLRIVEIEEEALNRQLQEWKMLFPGGVEGREELLLLHQQQQQQQRERGREGGKESIPKTGLNRPKHGREDEKNEVHVGGNTWAGGVGGSDTAGMGGRGGPYRLDKGHVVHQVSDEMKKQVGEEAREEAARMGREALEQRLREIGMSEGDWSLYEGIMKRVNQQVGQLREILREGGRKGKDRGREREWRRNQSQGELDDDKLVDGMAGERLVFKRRADVEEEEEEESYKGRKGGKKGKKRRMLFVMDTSGSMYRFNGEDGRLDRMLEVATMIMESFEKDEEGREGEDEDEVEYAIRAHSGDSAKVPLVEFGKPPKTRKEKLAVLEKMAAHAQYCLAGDNTLRATEEAAAELAAYQQQEQGEGREGGSDASYLFVVSDANFERYGIPPRRLGEALVRHGGSVRGHVFLIASLGEEAKEAVRQMPVGRAHLCLEVEALPGAMKKIFVEELNR